MEHFWPLHPPPPRDEIYEPCPKLYFQPPPPPHPQYITKNVSDPLPNITAPPTHTHLVINDSSLNDQLRKMSYNVSIGQCL